MEVKADNISIGTGTTHNTNLEFIPSAYRPSGTPASLIQRSVANNIIIYMWSNEIGLTNTYTSTQTGQTIWQQVPYFY